MTRKERTRKESTRKKGRGGRRERQEGGQGRRGREEERTRKEGQRGRRERGQCLPSPLTKIDVHRTLARVRYFFPEAEIKLLICRSLLVWSP
jgi:hypothetical protein